MKQLLLSFSLVITIFVISSFTNNLALQKDSTTQKVRMNVKGVNLDFTLVNETGYDISDVYVAPTNQREWGDDIMGKDIVADGESVDITFDTDETTKKWDIYVTWVGYKSDEDVYWVDFDLSKISEITLHYDEKTGKTWATTK